MQAVALRLGGAALTDTFERFVRTRIGLEPLVIDAAGLADVLRIEIDRPAEAGADRLCNSWRRAIEFGGPAIVVDLGTSTNFDVISADAGGVGGAIAPGLGLCSRRWSAMPASCRGSICGGFSNDHRRQYHPRLCRAETVLGYIGLVSGC